MKEKKNHYSKVQSASEPQTVQCLQGEAVSQSTRGTVLFSLKLKTKEGKISTRGEERDEVLYFTEVQVTTEVLKSKAN